MGEALPNIPDTEPPAPDAQFEQLADWLIRYEATQGERSRKLPLFEVASEDVEAAATELQFERRHEVKDEAQPNHAYRFWRLQPMTPISRVIQENPIDVNKSTIEISPQPAPHAKRYNPGASYGQPIRRGFMGGVAVILILAIVSILR